MKTILILVGGIALIIAGIIGYNLKGNDLSAARESNVFTINEAGEVLTESRITGEGFTNPTDVINSATSTNGSLSAGTYYLVLTTLDGVGGETLPTTEMTCAVGSEVHDSTSTACTFTFTEDATAASHRLWFSDTSGTYINYFVATSSTNFATSTLGISTGTIATVNSAYKDADLVVLDGGRDYNATTAPGIITTGKGVLHSITLSQSDVAPTAGLIQIADGIADTSTPIFSFYSTTTVFAPTTVILDADFATGLYIDFAGPADVWVTTTYK